MRVLCYVQHLSGAGHFVRTHAIACGLARAHEVLLVDGGRPVPRLASPPGLALLSLPRIHRHAGAIVAIDDPRPLKDVMDERTRRLIAAVVAAPPDVVTVEHYPWSKWELEAETLAMIAAARHANPAVRVVCSLRDVAPPTRYEAVGQEAFTRRVLERLAAHFDAVLVHSDPAFTRLEEHFGGADDMPVPWAYTGFVQGALPPGPVPSHPARSGPYAVLSAGGSAPTMRFLHAAIEAFRRLRDRGELGEMRLVVFGGLFMDSAALGSLGPANGDGAVTVLPFSPDFPAWLRDSEVSVSHSGYNTCVDLLAARVPAVLTPHPAMSDQRFRADRLHAHGFAVVVSGDPPSMEALADAIRRARAAPSPARTFAVDGVEQSCRLLERLNDGAAPVTGDWTPSRVPA